MAEPLNSTDNWHPGTEVAPRVHRDVRHVNIVVLPQTFLQNLRAHDCSLAPKSILPHKIVRHTTPSYMCQTIAPHSTYAFY